MQRRLLVRALLGLALLTPAAGASAGTMFDPPAFVQSWPDSVWIRAITLGNDGTMWAIGNRAPGLLRFHDGIFEEVAPVAPQIAVGGDQFVQLDDGRFALGHGNGVRVFDTAGHLADFIAPWFDCAVGRDGSVVGVRGAHPAVLDIRDITGTELGSWTGPSEVINVAVDSGKVFALAWEESGIEVRVYSMAGVDLARWPVGNRWDNRIFALPSGKVCLLPPDNSSDSILLFSRDGVLLCEWFFHDRNGEWTTAPYLVTEDSDESLLCQEPYYLDRFAPIGPGAIVVPDQDDVPFVVDDVSYTGPQRFLWDAGTQHTLSAPLHTRITALTYRDFVDWSGIPTPQYELTAPASGQGIRLNLQTYHWIETSVDSVATITPSLWAPEGESLTITATPDSGYAVIKWGHPDSTGWQPFDVLEAEWTHVVDGPERWKAYMARDGLIFTISASDTDPWVNTAPPAGGPRQLWLWAANLDHGISALEADVAGTLTPFGFLPEGGILNLGSGSNLFCAIPGCPVGMDVALRLGSWWVLDEGGDLCLQPSALSGLMAAAECPSDFPDALPIGVVGFSSIGEPCLAGTMVPAHIGPDDAPELVGPAGDTLVLRVRGNPFRTSVNLDADLPVAGAARVRIFDVAGRLVQTVWSGALPAGRRSFAWDGRSGDGPAVSPGIYFARLDAPGGRRLAKLVRIAR